MKHPLALLVLLSIFAFVGSAHALTCGPGIGTPFLWLSAATNAHGANSAGTYTTAIGCTESGVTIGPTQPNAVTVLNLSNSGNGHAEIPNGPAGYGTPIQVGVSGTGILGVQVLDNTGIPPSSWANCPANYSPVVRLSDVTNAHLEIGTGTNYPILICAGYSASGVVEEDVLAISSLSGNGIPVAQGNTAHVIIPTQNIQASDLAYNWIDTLQVIAICDTADTTIVPIASGGSGYPCSQISRYADYKREIDAFLAGNPSILRLPQTVRLNLYGTNSPTYGGLYSAYTGPKSTFSSLTGTLNTPYDYAIDTSASGFNLPAGNYRLLVTNLLANYNHSSLGTLFENVNFKTNNFSALNFTVDPGTGGGPSGDGSDVYVLRELEFPNVYENQNITVNLTVQNKIGNTDAATCSTQANITIRDGDGIYVTGYRPADNVSVPLDFPCAQGNETITQPFIVQTAGTPFLRIGETYTLYATIPAYDDPSPTGTDETVTSNNSAFRVFTVLEAPNQVSVPDMPAWMSVLVMGIVLGWLFVRGRKDE